MKLVLTVTTPVISQLVHPVQWPAHISANTLAGTSDSWYVPGPTSHAHSQIVSSILLDELSDGLLLSTLLSRLLDWLLSLLLSILLSLMLSGDGLPLADPLCEPLADWLPEALMLSDVLTDSLTLCDWLSLADREDDSEWLSDSLGEELSSDDERLLSWLLSDWLLELDRLDEPLRLLDRLLDALAPLELPLMELPPDSDEDSDSLTDENDLLDPRLSDSSSSAPVSGAKVSLSKVFTPKVSSIALSPLRLCSRVSASDEPLIGLELRSGAVRESLSLESLADAGKANDDAHDGVFRIGLHSHADGVAIDNTQT